MKRIIPFAFAALLLSCSGNKNQADAFGNFESDEVIISAENNGRIIRAFANEGDNKKAGELLAISDTTNLSLQIAQLASQKESTLAQKNNVEAQLAITDQQISNINKDLSRINKMLKDGAATQKQLDDVTGQIDLANKQKRAYASQLNAIQKQADAVQAQIKVLQDRINASLIKAPIDGIVLEKYCEAGELAVPGKALFKMANIESLQLRVYISETQLSNVKIGQQVKVLIDSGDTSKELSGKVEWIASQAEFTPKIIQTKEERVKLVYAVKVRVQNDGSLKIGMPGEVVF